MKFELQITFDMCLDAYLKLVITNGNEVRDIGQWRCHKMNSDPSFNQKYRCNSDKTEYKFSLDIPKGFEVDPNRSTVSFGFTGQRDMWVGPGRLFTYTLSQLKEMEKRR